MPGGFVSCVQSACKGVVSHVIACVVAGQVNQGVAVVCVVEAWYVHGIESGHRITMRGSGKTC